MSKALAALEMASEAMEEMIRLHWAGRHLPDVGEVDEAWLQLCRASSYVRAAISDPTTEPARLCNCRGQPERHNEGCPVLPSGTTESGGEGGRSVDATVYGPAQETDPSPETTARVARSLLATPPHRETGSREPA